MLTNDGLKGFPEAIASVYPQTVVQTCIVHLIRNSLAYVAWKDRKAILMIYEALHRSLRKMTRGSLSKRRRGVEAALSRH